MSSHPEPVEYLFARLKIAGGAIVRAEDCSHDEIHSAKTFANYAEDEKGAGFILRSSTWLETVNQQMLSRVVLKRERTEASQPLHEGCKTA